MSEIVSQSLQKIAKGTGIVFISTIIGMLLAFIERVLLAGFFTQAEYGTYSLALVLLNIFVTISLFGLQDGVARQIGYYRGMNDSLKVRGIIFFSIQIVLIASVILSPFLFFTSDFLSTKIFHDSALATPLKIFAFAIPFSALTQLFVSIFRGFESIKENVYFQNILRNTLFPAFIIIIIFLGLPFINAIYVFTASIVVTFVVFALYVIKNFPLSLRGSRRILAGNPVGRELLFFSVPILGVLMLDQIINWADTLMLGYFKPSDVVGLYNGALPLARLIPVILNSVGFIYVPIITGFYSKKLMGEMGRTYQVLTKWIFSATLPIFFILFLFPETILNFIFGTNYIQAASTLRILAFSFMFHVILSFNGHSLLVMGETRFLMLNSLFGAILNIALNAALIPIFGIVGAAISSLSSYSAVNILASIKLYNLSKIHPFTRSYIKMIGISTFLLALIYTFTSVLEVKFWMLPFLLLFFLFAYSLLSLLTRSFDKEDIDIILTIEERTGIYISKYVKYLRR